MALKDWKKLHDDDYETKEFPHGRIWIRNHGETDWGKNTYKV